MPHIASTLPTDVIYTMWKSNPVGVNGAHKKVIIHGGHGVAHRRKHGGLETPNGILTKVTDDELELLEKDETFITHKKNGFIKVLKSEKPPAAEKVAKDMEQADASAPLSEKDFQEGGRAAAPKDLQVSTFKEQQSRKGKK